MANEIKEPFSYFDIAESLLTTLNEVFASNQVFLPERQYVAVGPENTVAYDCEQLTVTFKNVSDGLAYNDVPRMLSCQAFQSGIFFVELVRCIPTTGATGLKVSMPTSESISESSRNMMRDAKLFREVVDIIKEDPTIMDKPMYSITFGEPNGGFQSVQLSIKRNVF